MKIVVIEDNQDFSEITCNTINKLLIENNFDYDVVSFLTFDEKLKRLIHNNETKIYIVDIELGTKSGYDVCRMIRESASDWNSIIIISSVHNQKETILALRLSVFTYLSKFVNFEQELKTTILEAIRILEKNKLFRVDKDTQISVNHICYVMKELNSKYCIIKTIYDEYKVRTTLKKLTNELNLTSVRKYLSYNKNNIVAIYNNKLIFKNKIEIKFD